ncbi:MAG: ferredoxin, partial [Flavobacteriaceae bacterium]
LSEAFYVKENSRLACQIQLQPNLAGLVVRLAPEG